MSAVNEPAPASLPDPTPNGAAPASTTNSTPAPQTTKIALRAPSSLPSQTSHKIEPPSLKWLEGTWHVMHSSLPLWKKNKNVRITYKRISGTSPAHLDDVVSYSPIGSDKVKTVHGVDKPFEIPSDTKEASGGEDHASLGYNWRGKGWLVIATSKWELLGHGTEEGTGVEWAVTYFAKTLVSPPGVDVYARNGLLSEQSLEEIKEALKGLGGDVKKLAGDIFEVARDA